MGNDTTDALRVETYIGRQPIFDRSKGRRAYELLYRASADATHADFVDDHVATLQVIANTLFNTDRAEPRGRLFINYSSQAVVDKVPLTFPPGSVVKVKESMATDAAFMRSLTEIRAADYIIAVDEFTGRAEDTTLYALADIIIVDFLQPAADIARLIQEAASHGSTIMAKRIENNEQFERAKDLGIDLFQGFFFHKPEVVPGKRFTTSECSRLNLLEFIKCDEPDFDALAEAVQMDAALTHRMLFYINSPYFGVSTNITSVKHAIAMLGWNKVKNLLYMVILTDAASPLSSELFITSATRAMFLKLVAQEHPEVAQPPDELYILGLLSLLDTIFQVPMTEVVSNIALDPELKNMLVTRQGDLYRWLELAMAFESGTWEQADRTITALDLDFIKVSKSFYEALQWVNSFYGTLE